MCTCSHTHTKHPRTDGHPNTSHCVITEKAWMNRVVHDSGQTSMITTILHDDIHVLWSFYPGMPKWWDCDYVLSLITITHIIIIIIIIGILDDLDDDYFNHKRNCFHCSLFFIRSFTYKYLISWHPITVNRFVMLCCSVFLWLPMTPALLGSIKPLSRWSSSLDFDVMVCCLHGC